MGKFFEERATKAFRKRLQEQVAWLIKKSWVSNLKGNLQSISSTIDAGLLLGVTKSQPFTEEEIKKTADELSPFRELEMVEDAKRVLISLLRSKGLTKEELGPENVVFYSFDETMEKLNVDAVGLKRLIRERAINALREEGETVFECGEIDDFVDKASDSVQDWENKHGNLHHPGTPGA